MIQSVDFEEESNKEFDEGEIEIMQDHSATFKYIPGNEAHDSSRNRNLNPTKNEVNLSFSKHTENSSFYTENQSSAKEKLFSIQSTAKYFYTSPSDLSPLILNILIFL